MPAPSEIPSRTTPPKESSTTGLWNVVMTIAIITVIISLVLYGKHKSSGGSNRIRSSELVPLDTKNWTFIKVDPTKEWVSITIMTKGLYYTEVIDGDFNNPIILPSSRKEDSEVNGKIFQFTLNEGQGKESAELLVERKPRY